MAGLSEHLEQLRRISVELIEKCALSAWDGSKIYTPDTSGAYPALWTRDFADLVEYAWDLLEPGDAMSNFAIIAENQRMNGAVSDRVQVDGLAVFSPGPVGSLFSFWPALDNQMYFVLAACELAQKMDRIDLIAAMADPLFAALSYVPRDVNGLVWCNPERPCSTYGYTDTVRKEGAVLFCSLLWWRAAKKLSALARRLGGELAAPAEDLAGEARIIESSFGLFWDNENNALLAATEEGRKIDIWGSLYAIYIDFPLGNKRERLLDFLFENLSKYTWRGQVRHLLEGTYWEKLFMEVKPGTYQNGAYWAHASGWCFHALAQRDMNAAERFMDELVAYLGAEGIFECVNGDYQQFNGYVSSGTIPYGVLKNYIDA